MRLGSVLLRHLYAAGLAAMSAVPAAAVHAATVPEEAAPAEIRVLSPKAANSTNERPARGSRLRFRGNGPTCMCADGLDERQIRARSRADTSTTQSTSP